MMVIQKMQDRVGIATESGRYMAPCTTIRGETVVALTDGNYGMRLTITHVGTGLRVCGDWPPSAKYLNEATAFSDRLNAVEHDWSIPVAGGLRPIIIEVNASSASAWEGEA